MVDLSEQKRAEEERKRAEEALRVSEERWSKLAENSSAGIALLAQDGRFIAANLALQKMLGYTEDELQGRIVLDITHEEDRASTEARMAEADEEVRRVRRVEKRYLRKDGGVMWADVSGVFVPASGSNSAFFSTVIVDITERKRAEEELHRKEAELAHVSRVTTIVALYLNRRQWPFTALNSWTGTRSTRFNSWTELYLNRRQLRFLLCPRK